MIKIYHNPRCKKSRAGLAALEASGKEYTIVDYFRQQFTKVELQQLLSKSGLPVSSFVRTQEAFFKEHLKGKTLSDEMLIDAILKEPKLLKRPLIESNDRVILADPIQNLHNIL